MSQNEERRTQRKRRTAAVVAVAGASGVLIAMGGSAVLAQAPPPPAPPPPPGQAPGLQEQPPGGQNNNQNGGLQENQGTDQFGGIDTGMTVQSVNVVHENLHDNEPEQVEYRFAKPVVSVGNPASFELSGFATGANAKAQSAKIVSGDTNAVLTEYAPGTDVRAFTVAITDSQAVKNESGRTNLPNTVALSGSNGQVSGTDSAQLKSVRVNPTLNRVAYTFDRQLKQNGGGADASKLGLNTRDGRAIMGQSIVAETDDTVTVQFAKQVGDGVRQFAMADAVTDSRGVQNAPTSIGQSTTAPNLESVSGLIGRTQFDYTFSEPVTVNDAKNFVVYTADGKAIQGSGVVQPSANVVRVAYPEIQNYGQQISLAAVNGDAVRSSDGSATPNVVGSENVGGNRSSSLTSGPDLKSASVDTGTGQVRLEFDQPIDDNKTYDKAGFQLVTAAGDRVNANSIVEVNGNSVLVNFNRAAADAANSVTVAGNAVQDKQGNGNPLANQSLGAGANNTANNTTNNTTSNLNNNGLNENNTSGLNNGSSNNSDLNGSNLNNNGSNDNGLNNPAPSTQPSDGSTNNGGQ